MSDRYEKQSEAGQVSEVLKNLEARISRIEQHLNLEPVEFKETAEAVVTQRAAETTDTLEFQIGHYWFAKVGIVALIIGIVFLLLQPYSTLFPAFAPILGYILAGTVALFSRYMRKSFPFLSGYLLGSGLVLLYFATLRLHYFSEQPALADRAPEIILLLIVVIINLIISSRRKSVYMTALSLTMGYAAALMSEWTYSFFIIVTVMTLLTIYIELKYKWHHLLTYGIVLTYFTYILWFINNPLVGNPLALRASSFGTALFVLLWALIFAAGNFIRGKDQTEDSTVIISSLLNGLGAYTLYLLTTLTESQEHLAVSHLVASSVFLILAIAFWLREKSRYQTFFYAMIGYAALSVAIIAQFKTPYSFVWLCWQSLLVVSTSVWFRSKFIVVTNFIIYAIIFIAYLVLAGTVSATSLSFGVVALVSARILNWQRHRLELRTELMRNAYLIAAFFIFPYALYYIVPSDYISLSWIAVAILYYVLSLILKSIKYRWMALSTFLLTALYLLIIGITKLEPVYRIVSFLILGIALLIISFIYARTRIKTSSKDESTH
ncbi:MAG: DUF2339 domain-containing protein [Bacteroidetes bacterium]|nr:DUF2339 domain-containing protein [Bacteroidota bacterium]MCL5738404.1 DUF2339 domain-containing protein [Bacteroidota bacterium]